MSMTFQLLGTSDLKTRKDGAISYVNARILVDGIERGANFRTKVGDEPIVIDGDTITVSDEMGQNSIDRAREGIAMIADREATAAAQIARFGPLAEIVAVSDAQRRFAEDRRLEMLPLLAADLDARAERLGLDADTAARIFAHVAAKAEARWWIDLKPTFEGQWVGMKDLMYHFA